MKKLTLETLNNLFEYLTSQADAILWISSCGYARQIYLSPNFEKLWGYSNDTLYKNPKKFKDFLYKDDRDMYYKILAQDEQDHDRICYLYRIITGHGELKYVRDWHYILTTEEDYVVGLAGIAEFITEESWHEELLSRQTRQSKDSPIQLVQQQVLAILQSELHLNTMSASIDSPKLAYSSIKNKDGIESPLTARESECLSYLMKGMSAKETATVLNISQRTVEFHLDNIKMKSGCRTKIELLSQVSTSSLHPR